MFEPVYSMSNPNEPILLYEGELVKKELIAKLDY